jgi:hypothetical protein
MHGGCIFIPPSVGVVAFTYTLDALKLPHVCRLPIQMDVRSLARRSTFPPKTPLTHDERDVFTLLVSKDFYCFLLQARARKKWRYAAD